MFRSIWRLIKFAMGLVGVLFVLFVGLGLLGVWDRTPNRPTAADVSPILIQPAASTAPAAKTVTTSQIVKQTNKIAEKNPPVISAMTLQAAFKQNNLRAETQYSGHVYDVTGPFDEAKKEMFGEVQVSLMGEFLPSFMGTLANGEDSSATKLNRGEMIRLRCTLRDTTMDVPTGRDCHVVQ